MIMRKRAKAMNLGWFQFKKFLLLLPSKFLKQSFRKYHEFLNITNKLFLYDTPIQSIY